MSIGGGEEISLTDPSTRASQGFRREWFGKGQREEVPSLPDIAGEGALRTVSRRSPDPRARLSAAVATKRACTRTRRPGALGLRRARPATCPGQGPGRVCASRRCWLWQWRRQGHGAEGHDQPRPRAPCAAGDQEQCAGLPGSAGGDSGAFGLMWMLVQSHPTLLHLSLQSRLAQAK